MPPSGYDKIQISALKSFLKSCSEALAGESVERAETYNEALARECTSIKRELKKGTTSNFQSVVLSLTLLFYEKVADHNIKSYNEFVKSVDHVLSDFHVEIEGIHIVEESESLQPA